MFAEDNKSEAQLIKEQIEREYKEIEECKKGKKKEKNNGKAKMVSVEYRQPTDSNRIIGSYMKQQKKNGGKCASTPNESIISTDTIFKWFNIPFRLINGEIPIVAKLVLSLGFSAFNRVFKT